ncbi:uncharacterized protein DUF1203 [Aminobacter aminovorans]|uniref:Protein of uncharacterized function (DUF1203) n=1 Tax=Aminobacter aminovorans TaxID=83263 RepID=A0A380WM35_AMIAI|nr:DUF1203 domain-containing protein [Aminobacter aminovorans]TCS26237.1 uncharacterized protein DUF1203 [Aminobacter aminovorans]SUU90099.1 Protein of uncharacterised function (DUF1203) [Aminobacter aminovorans]
MSIIFHGLPTEAVRALQQGGADAYGMKPERRVSDGDGVPCRHCLTNVAAGKGYLILAYRPFPAVQPYAETGPIFLHAEECPRAPEAAELPELFTRTRDYILRGYSADDRIVYGTGAVTPTPEIRERAETLLQRPDVAYVHMRSAKNNCYQCRIELDQAGKSSGAAI